MFDHASTILVDVSDCLHGNGYNKIHALPLRPLFIIVVRVDAHACPHKRRAKVDRTRVCQCAVAFVDDNYCRKGRIQVGQQHVLTITISVCYESIEVNDCSNKVITGTNKAINNKSL